MRNEEDKYRKKDGRRAAHKEEDSKYLNQEALEDDLVSEKEAGTDDDGKIVDSKHPENQEWNVREDHQ